MFEKLNLNGRMEKSNSKDPKNDKKSNNDSPKKEGSKKNIFKKPNQTTSKKPTDQSQKKPSLKKKWTVGRIIMWIVILGLIGFLIWFIFFSGRTFAISENRAMELLREFLNPNQTEAEIGNLLANRVSFITYNNSIGIAIYNGRDTNVFLVDTIQIAEATLDSWVTEITTVSAQGSWGDYVNRNFPPQPNFFASLLLNWGPWIIMMVVAWLIVKSIIDKQNNKMGGKIYPKYSNVKFDDVAGYKEIKNELVELVDFLKNPVKYSEAGIRTPKGVLLSGPPGTGKTLFAKAVAGEAKVPFFSISGSDFVEMYVGVGAKRVRELFKTAIQNAPTIIFIDELDAVGRQRGAGVGGGNDEREQTLNQLLVELDGFQTNTGVIVLAATNRPDVLDAAITRPGRFDRSILLRLPDVGEREAILKRHTRGKKISKDLNLYNIALRTPGFSGAQLENVINEAAILSVRERRNELTIGVIDEAIDRVIGGPAKVDYSMSLEEKKLVSYHESGHALIGLKLKHAQKVQKISIVPRGIAGGYVLMTPKKEKLIRTKNELEASIISYMGGRAAEEIKFGANEITTGASSDIEESTKIARRMVTQFGMSSLGPIQLEENNGSIFLGRELGQTQKHSSKLGFIIDQEVQKIISNSYKKAYKIIKDNMNLLELFSKALLIKETLTSEEIDYINKNSKLPDSVVHFKERQRKELERREKLRKEELKRELEKAKNEANSNNSPKKTGTVLKNVNSKIDNKVNKKTEIKDSKTQNNKEKSENGK